MPFKLSKGSSRSVESPEALFQDLRLRRIQGLLAHQADILREYIDNGAKVGDVAFQLPTGSGKTLVGLLIGEWRRIQNNERVVYLCPTKQLVHQVAAQARDKYGLEVHEFTGPKTAYPSNAKSAYINAEAIAITSYSSLFNTNPFFNDPQVIVLDDAHAAESYVADNWSLQIDRFEHETLFTGLAAILQAVVPATDAQRLNSKVTSTVDKPWVQKLPTPTFFKLIPEIASLIDAHTPSEPRQPPPKFAYPWKFLRDHLHACHLYISAQEILIRPLIVPTDTHTPFSGARQRIYMSATLGQGGELERITGRKQIKRLEGRLKWDRQTIGRRFFMFPGRSLDAEQTQQVILDMIRQAGRALVLVPDEISARQVRGLIQKDNADCQTFVAREIEQSKDAFLAQASAAAVIANRYDGIDFPEDECRLLVVDGVPQATNLQEQFIITRMGAVALLHDRILTRMNQAFGRCTRSATDYAAVVIWGDKLLDYLQNREHRERLHPELQAEIQFGIDQSKDQTSNGFIENLKEFLGQSKNWVEADAEILSLRDQLNQTPLPGYQDLRKAVQHEVDYQNAIWHHDFIKALECCRQVLAVAMSDELRGYRALWNYLAGSAAWLAWKTGDSAGFEQIAREYYRKANHAAPAVNWLVALVRSEAQDDSQPTHDQQVTAVIERLESVLGQLGTTHDRKFDSEIKKINDGLTKGTSRQFEEAHRRLGHLLGYETDNVETPGAPDPWWLADENLCFVFEDHSDAQAESSLNITKARQVGSHPNWIRSKGLVSENAVVVPVLITPVQIAESEALPHLKAVALWSLSDFRTWAKNALMMVRELRGRFAGAGDLVWRAEAISRYKELGIDPQSLLKYLQSRPASKLLKS